LGFSSEGLDSARAVWSVFGPFGNTSLGWLEGQAGVVGGTSATQQSAQKISDDITKEILSTFANANNIPGAGIIKPLSIALGVVGLADMATYGEMDQIIKGFFQRNSIPTSHTVVTHNGRYDTTAAALLSAQMSAAYLFIQENAWYFLCDIWAGNTLHTMDQSLLSPSRRGPLDDHSIDSFVNRVDRYLQVRYSRGDFLGARFNIGGTVASLNSFLNDFEMRTNFVNTMFMATMAHVTCSVISNIPAVPPPLLNTSNQLNQQAQQAQQSLQQAHTTARSDLIAAHGRYRDVYNSLTSSQQQHVSQGGINLRVEEARRDFEAAVHQYEQASRFNGQEPSLSRTLNTDWERQREIQMQMQEQHRAQITSQTQPPVTREPHSPNTGPGLSNSVEPELK